MTHATATRTQESAQRLAQLGLLALTAALLLGGLGSFGIWDPWELTVADQAREIAAGGAWPEHDPRGALLSAIGFRLFGVHEWAGRLPAALCGGLCVLLAFATARRLLGFSAALSAGLVTLTTPLFLLNALPMGGYVLGMALQAATVAAGLKALLGGGQDSHKPFLFLVLSLVAATAATSVYGLLVGALAPVLALAIAGALLLAGRFPGLPIDRRVALAFALTGAIDALLVLRAVTLDSHGYSMWTGGFPRAQTPPGFDMGLEALFHSLSPWSALLPLALALPLLPPSTPETSEPEGTPPLRSRLGLLAMIGGLWCAAGYGAQTLFLARYGDATVFLPVVGVALSMACLLAQLMRPGFPALFVGITATLLVGLIFREYALFPEAPLEGMPLKAVSVPEVFNPKGVWAVLLGMFAASLTLPFAMEEHGAAFDARAPYRLLANQLRRGPAFMAWLGVLGSLSLGLLLVGALAWASPQTLGLSRLGTRIARIAGVLTIMLPVAVFAGQWLLHVASRLGRFRLAPLLASAGLIGLYLAHGFLPALSGHLSPRDLYESFNRLAGANAELAEYEVGGGGADYYVQGEVKHLSDFNELVRYLQGSGRRWAAIREKDLASVDARYRQAEAKHLVVADGSNGRIALVTNQPVPGQRDANPLRRVVLEKAPTIERKMSAQLGRSIEVLGYNVGSRRPDEVSAGETFSITWYYRVLRRIPADNRVFVHIDGHGTRVHGDHDPADGKYPMRLWKAGDIIADHHRVSVPASTPVGDYEVFMGFFRGDHRLPVEEGPHDSADRVRAGVLHIR